MGLLYTYEMGVQGAWAGGKKETEPFWGSASNEIRIMSRLEI